MASSLCQERSVLHGVALSCDWNELNYLKNEEISVMNCSIFIHLNGPFIRSLLFLFFPGISLHGKPFCKSTMAHPMMVLSIGFFNGFLFFGCKREFLLGGKVFEHN